LEWYIRDKSLGFGESVGQGSIPYIRKFMPGFQTYDKGRKWVVVLVLKTASANKLSKDEARWRNYVMIRTKMNEPEDGIGSVWIIRGLYCRIKSAKRNNYFR
jgi:hypothetical protein